MGFYLPFPHPALALDDVSVALGGLTILDSVTLSAPRGAVTGLIGPNGAGKTTVFNVLSGFVRPDSGRIAIDGRTIRRVHPHDLTRHGVARTLQGVGLFPALTVVQNVALGARARHGFFSDAWASPWADRESRAHRARAVEILAEFGISDVADRLPGELPYPVQKRVALARSMMSDPSIVLLDEPAGGISASDIAELAGLIRSWVPQRTVLLVEHHMELVMEVCDFIWVLDAGSVIAQGTPEQVRQDPAVLAAYLGEPA